MGVNEEIPYNLDPKRRSNGEPIAYIISFANDYSLTVTSPDDMLIIKCRYYSVHACLCVGVSILHEHEVLPT